MKSIKVYFDLDGTLFNLYGKENWLEMLESETVGVFQGSESDLMENIDLEELYEGIQALANYGVEFNVITWLPMQASREYEEICAKEKTEWVRKVLPFINEVVCQPYGTPKQKGISKRANTMILIDDNKEVCNMWKTNKQRRAIQVDNEYSALEALMAILTSIENGVY